MFCERCGLNFLPRQSVCTRCGAAATRHWLQLIGLTTLMLAFACNSLVAWFLLPRHAASHQGQLVFHTWFWLDDKIARYGWVPLAIGLLVWDFLVLRGSRRPKIRGWVTRKLLTFSLVAGVTPFIPTWVPAGQPSQNFLQTIRSHPGMPLALAWGVVVVVISLVCMEAETRDSLLGQGKVLSLVGLGTLCMLLGLTLWGWSIA
ncbi:MAG TPA: hypothetical protein VMH00_13940 [Candidatus Limnocylindrales bacterium]|nr:hypothetical protein [Candidatus Limnocylindrales bacterium]